MSAFALSPLFELASSMEERLQKILSQWGIASRRQAEQMIVGGRITLNNETATLGQKADPVRDCIRVDGVQIQSEHRPDPLYLLLNKPIGVVCTCQDPQSRSTVLDYVPDSIRYDHGLHPVGRLDTDSTGALLLTNDGEFTFALTHPKHWIEKTYLVWLSGSPSFDDLQRWRTGINVDGRKTLPASVRRLSQQRRVAHGQTLLEVKLREGRNRQIRRVAEQLGYPVLRLHRIAIGSLQLGSLAKGECRSLTSTELRQLQNQIQADIGYRGSDRPRMRRSLGRPAAQEFVPGGSRSRGERR